MLHEVQEICDSVALVEKGKLLAYDRIENLEQLFRATKINVELLQPADSELVEKIRKLKNVEMVVAEQKTLTITFRGKEAEQAELLSSLVKDLKVPIVSFKPSLEALEEVYLHLVKEGN